MLSEFLYNILSPREVPGSLQIDLCAMHEMALTDDVVVQGLGEVLGGMQDDVGLARVFICI